MADAAAKVPAKTEDVAEEKEEKASGEAAEKSDIAEGETEGGEGAEATAKPKKNKLKLILLITIPTLLLLGGGAAAYFFFFAKKHHAPVEGEAAANGDPAAAGAEAEKTAEETVKDEKPDNTFYHELPDMMVNLNSENNKVSYLKLKASLELDDQKSVDKLNKVMPRILDTIQVYVRELTVNDLKSSLGIEKLRQELLKRILLIAKDVKIYDILFPEILTQ